MIQLDRKFIHAIQSSRVKEDLYPLLQNAVELEHSTIPPYLTALFSLAPNSNVEIRQCLHAIVVQEMAHMTIVGNILVAIGGAPAINTPDFIPEYPGKLPMGIGGSGFVVPIRRFSKQLLRDVFMVIEEPETPIPVRRLTAEAEPQFGTIGEFYRAVSDKIRELGDDIFVVGTERQVLGWFDESRVFPIVDVATATRGIDVIVVEGEGTSTNPFEAPGDPAHYYKFGEIDAGRRIVATRVGYAYAGDPIPFDESAVYPMVDNPKIDDLPLGSKARILTERYAYTYSSLLNALHVAFNGEPARMKAAIGLMYSLKIQAVDLMTTHVNGRSETAGPVYEYRQTEAGVE